ncbi:MAG TPA: BON domain-containing protein [Opitutaceae bacterium]|nr:BON domain-containing protein [Opitutaceae bacterium]
MRTLFVFVLGLCLGAIALHFYQAQPGRGHVAGFDSSHYSSAARDAANEAGAKARGAASGVSATISEKMREWHLTPDDIHEDLAKSGRVARENVARLRERAADARIVAVIKAKYVLDRNLSAGTITVASSGGDVVLTGTVDSETLIGRAVALALDTEGVHHVTAKLIVAAAPATR